MQGQISRRDVLIRGGLVLGGLGAVVRPGTAWAAQRSSAGTVYRLEATDRCSCAACHRHAENKLFATRAAADDGRAHPGCQCAVVAAPPLPVSQWRALFGAPSDLRRTSVDRRRASTRRTLKRVRRAA